MDFRQVGRALRDNWVVVAAVFLLCALIGGVAAYSPAKKYQASTLLIAQPASAADAATAVNTIQFFVPQLALEAQDRAALVKLAKAVPARFAHASVAVAATADPETGTLTVTGTSTNPAAAAAFVDADANYLTGLEASNPVFTLLEPSSADIPDSPINPRKEILLGALVFGLIAAVFAGLGSDAIRRRLSQVEETRSRIGLPVLAEIPRTGRHALHPDRVFSPGTHPLIQEAFQELRSNLLLALPQDRPAAVAVISGDPGEGKSSVAADLAWALASEGNPVTLIDCDLRKPTLHMILGTALGPGLSGRGSLDLDHVMCPTDNPNLNVIPAGIPDRHPVDIISANMPSLLSDLRDEGRHAIVDCPPLNGVAETLLLAAVVDVVVFVIDARRFDPEHVQHHQTRLQEAGATVVGVVLNRVRMGAKRWDRSHSYAIHHPESGQPFPPIQVSSPKPTSARRQRNVS